MEREEEEAEPPHHVVRSLERGSHSADWLPGKKGKRTNHRRSFRRWFIRLWQVGEG